MRNLKELYSLVIKDDDDAFYELGDRLSDGLVAALSRYKDDKALPDSDVQYDVGGQAGTYYTVVNISTKDDSLYIYDRDVVQNCDTDKEVEDYYYDKLVEHFG